MAKLSKKSFKIMGAVGGLAGGVVAAAADSYLLGSISSSTPIKAGITAVAGAALSSFVKGDMVKGVGDGMVGAAGYQLGNYFLGSSATSGLGNALPGQNAIGRGNWVRKRTISGPVTASNPIPSGQQNVM